MGSIISKPKAPAPAPKPKVVYVTPEPEPIKQDPVEEPQPTSEEKDKSEEAVKEYLSRKRRSGRYGTITTSSRGVFDLNDLSPQRKSLLGE